MCWLSCRLWEGDAACAGWALRAVVAVTIAVGEYVAAVLQTVRCQCSVCSLVCRQLQTGREVRDARGWDKLQCADSPSECIPTRRHTHINRLNGSSMPASCFTSSCSCSSTCLQVCRRPSPCNQQVLIYKWVPIIGPILGSAFVIGLYIAARLLRGDLTDRMKMMDEGEEKRRRTALKEARIAFLEEEIPALVARKTDMAVIK